MDTILKITKTYPSGNSEVFFVTKVNNKSIRTTRRLGRLYSSVECSAITAGEAMVQHVLDYDSEKRGYAYKLEPVNQFEAYNYSMRYAPIIRFPQESEKTEQLGIKPWHHCMCFGNHMFLVVWDTRIIEKVIEISEQIPFNEAVFVNSDNDKTLKFNPTIMSDDARDEIATFAKANISIESFNSISWPK